MLEVKHGDRVRRVRILAKDGVYYIHKDRIFYHMDALLAYYATFPVAVVSEDDKCYLYPKRPFVLRGEESLGFGYVSFGTSELSSAGGSIFLIYQKNKCINSIAVVQAGGESLRSSVPRNCIFGEYARSSEHAFFAPTGCMFQQGQLDY